MRSMKVIVQVCILMIFAIFISSCGRTIEEPNNKQANSTSVNESSQEENSTTEKIKEKLKTTFEDIEGMWVGEIGYVSIQPGSSEGGMLGTITFHDNHDGAIFFFTGYKENATSLEFEVDPTMSGWSEHLSPFSINVQKVGESSIELKYQDFLYELEKTSVKEFQNKYVHDAYFGGIEMEASEEQVQYLEKELKELSDSEVRVGTLSNRFNNTNRVYTYIDYVGKTSSTEDIRSAVLQKVIEMNKVAGKYLWIDFFSVNVYLNNPFPGETEEDKQINVLSHARENNKENHPFRITTTVEDRWILSKKKVSTDELPAYVQGFGSSGVFIKEQDRVLNRNYPFYNAENLNSYSVLEQASIEGTTNNSVLDTKEENNKILETSKVKEILGYWHYPAMNEYYEITFNEFGGKINQSTGVIAGYSFRVTNETEDSIEISLATGDTWVIKRDGDQLVVNKSNGYDMILILSAKDDTDN